MYQQCFHFPAYMKQSVAQMFVYMWLVLLSDFVSQLISPSVPNNYLCFLLSPSISSEDPPFLPTQKNNLRSL